MQMVEIENRSNVVHKTPHDHVEKWQDKEIRIPPGGRIKMPRKEAIKFLGQYYPQTKAGTGDILDSKALVIVGDAGEGEATSGYISQVDGKDYGSEAGLRAHYDEIRRLREKDSLKSEIVSELGQNAQSAGREAFRCPHHNCDFSSLQAKRLLDHMKSHADAS